MPGLPAARIADMHTCANCMGTPQPIMPPGGVTVMIGGRPAARSTDICLCAGPDGGLPDPIVKGSTSVLIGGLPAARVGDLTVKGGVILPPGFPTVLIGG